MTSPVITSFNDFFKYSAIMYQFLPNNPYERFKNPSKSSLRRFIESSVYWLNLLSSSLVIVLQSIYLSDLVTKTDDIAKIISSAAWIPVSLIALEGIVFTGRHQRRVTRLINVLESSFPKTTAGQEVASVQETHYKWNRLSRIVTGFYFLALYVIYTLNFTLATISYFLTDEWNLKLPRLLWYPFDPHSSVARSILVYVWECWGTQATTRAVVTMGVFLGSISNHICVQFDGLTRRFLELRPSERTVKSDYEKLISLLREHNYLIRVCEELGDIFRASLLVNYVLSSIVIGCFGFLILNEPVMTQKMEYIFDFICFMCYNCLFSIYGDALMERSRGISQSIFHSEWLDGHIKYKKDLLFVMARSAKPFLLSGYFFFASYETYTKILTTSYSYLALLLATYRKQK